MFFLRSPVAGFHRAVAHLPPRLLLAAALADDGPDHGLPSSSPTARSNNSAVTPRQPHVSGLDSDNTSDEGRATLGAVASPSIDQNVGHDGAWLARVVAVCLPGALVRVGACSVSIFSGCRRFWG